MERSHSQIGLSMHSIRESDDLTKILHHLLSSALSTKGMSDELANRSGMFLVRIGFILETSVVVNSDPVRIGAFMR